jgi:hypothetical protein
MDYSGFISGGSNKKGNQPTSGYEHIVDWLSRDTYTAANMAQYWSGKSPYGSVWEAAWAGLSGKNRITFSKLTGNPWSGLLLDIGLSASTWIPFGAPARLLKATRIPTIADRAFIAFAEKVPYLSTAANATKNAIMIGFVDPLYRTKLLSGVMDSERALSKLKVSDDLVRMAKAGELTEDALKGLTPEAITGLKNVSKYYGFVRETVQLPRELKAQAQGLRDAYVELLKDYEKFEKANPKKAASFLNAMEYGLAAPKNTHWGMSDDFVRSIKELGVTDDEIAAIQHAIVQPEIVGKGVGQVDMYRETGHLMDSVPLRPDQWSTPEFTQLMDAALSKLDPSVRKVYDNALQVQKMMLDEGVKREFITRKIIEDFANRTGLAHIRHMPVNAAGAAVQKFTNEELTRLTSKMTDSVGELEKNLKAMNLPQKTIDEKVKDLRGFLRKLSESKVNNFFEKPENLVEMDAKIDLLLENMPELSPVRGTARELKKIVKEINQFRHVNGTAANIEKLTGKKVFETNLATISMAEEMRLKQAITYQDYLKKLIDSNLGFIERVADDFKAVDLPKDFGLVQDEVLGSFMVHKDLLRPFRLSVSFASGQGDDFMAVVKATDKITSAWKYGTLIPFAKFHIRNLASEVSFNMIAGMNPLLDPKIFDDYTDAVRIWKAAKAGKGGEEYLELIRKGVVQTGFMRTEAAIKEGSKLHKIPVVGRYLMGAEKVGSFTEEVPRIAMYKWAKRGGPARWKKYGVLSAEDLTRRFHVDYGKTTEFERGFMRRLMPFYSWYRFNIPLHIQMIPNAPGFYANVEKSRKALTEARGGDMPEWWSPEYIREGYAVGWSKKPGTRTYIILRGWYPAVDINAILSIKNMKDQFMQMLHPVKVIPETIWGYDTFRKRKIPAYPGEKVKVFGKNVPARLEHIMAPIRVIRETNALIFGTGTKQNSFWDRFVYTVFGKMYEVDVEKTKKYLKYDLNRMINDIDKGIAKAKDHQDYGTVKKLVVQKNKLEAEVKRL